MSESLYPKHASGSVKDLVVSSATDPRCSTPTDPKTVERMIEMMRRLDDERRQRERFEWISRVVRSLP